MSTKPLTEAERSAISIFGTIFSAMLVVVGLIVLGAIPDTLAEVHWIRMLVGAALIAGAITLQAVAVQRLCEVPKLQPGELVRFEDGSRWGVESIEHRLREPSKVTLRSLDAFMEARVFSKPRRGTSKRA